MTTLLCPPPKRGRPRKRRPLSAAQQIELIRQSPNHTPAWRYELAATLVDSNPLDLHVVADPWLIQACELRRTDLAEIPHVRNIHPATQTAWQLYQERSDVAQELEARVLGQQLATEIATILRLDVETVVAYEHLFYDVRDRLRHSDYILIKAIRPPWLRDHYEADLWAVLKLLAYHGGLAVFEAALDAWRDGLSEDRLAVPPDLATAAGRNRHSAKRLLVLESYPERLLDDQVAAYLRSLGEGLTSGRPALAVPNSHLSGKLANHDAGSTDHELAVVTAGEVAEDEPDHSGHAPNPSVIQEPTESTTQAA